MDDVYRYALVLWCLFTASWPFDQELGATFGSEFEFLQAIRAGQRPVLPAGLSPAVADLITRLWQTEEAEVREGVRN